ncbi:hypothetical protein D3C87_2059660 [compost metagenome]
MLDLVTDVRHQQLGVTDPCRLDEVDDVDQVIAHAVQDRNLKRLGRPLALVIGGLSGHVEIGIRPFDSGLRRFFVKCLES